MKFSSDLIISKIIRINTLHVQDQKALVQRVFELWSDIDTSNRSKILFLLRECFFRAMAPQQKEQYLFMLVAELNIGENINGDIFELIGQLIKYVPCNVQPIIQQTLLLSNKTLTTYDCICLMNFCKYVWDICNKKQQHDIRDLLHKLQKSKDNNLAEIATDVLYAIDSCPIRRAEGHTAFLIPEFMTSASFLQQPIDYMRALSIFYDYGMQGDIIDNRVHNYGLNKLAKILESYQVIVITSSPADMIQKYFLDFRYCIFCETVNWLFHCFPDKKIYVCGAHGTVDNHLLRKDICCHQILYGENTKAIINCFLNVNIEDAQILNYPLRLDAVDMNWYYGRKVINQITYRQKQYSILQLSQGCPYKCVFCYNIYGQKVNKMPVNIAITQLKKLQEIGVKHVFFIDQTFTLDCNYIQDLCFEMINSGLHITWQCETRADLITTQTVRTMKKAGCTAIWLGFESFSQQVLNANNKQLNKQQQIEAIQIITKEGIACSGFVMFGMISDTLDTIQETMDTILLYKIPTSRTPNLCTVRIGTELYEKANAAGLIQITSFCHLEAYKGRLFNDLSDNDLLNALQCFASKIR